MIARATMQNARMAQALGVRTGRIYAMSFGIGAGLAGLCGALYAPTMTLIPTMGATFIVESFVTVVVGGANVLLGTAPAAMFLALIRMALNAGYGQIVGQIGMLIAVILIIRILARGVLQRSGSPRALRDDVMFKLLERSADDRQWQDLLDRLPGGARGRPDLSAVRRLLRRRQFRLFPDLDIHGARPLPDVGLRRDAVVRPDLLLRHRRLRLWRARDQHGRRHRDDRSRSRCPLCLAMVAAADPRLFHDLGSASAASSSGSSPCAATLVARLLPGPDGRAGMAHRRRRGSMASTA